MSGDSHKMALGRHDVAQQAEMTIVDVETVEVEHSGHLLLHGLPDGLDAEAGEDLANVVGTGPHRVHVTFSQHLKGKYNTVNRIQTEYWT